MCWIKHIGSTDWINVKKAKINLKNKDDLCFQYLTTIALNFDETKNDAIRVSSIKPFINKYNWDGMKYPSKIDD